MLCLSSHFPYLFLFYETLGPPNPQPYTFLPCNSVPMYLTVPHFPQKKCFFKREVKIFLSNPSPLRIPKSISKQAEFERLHFSDYISMSHPDDNPK